jgi:hypothetical protein
MMRKWKENIVPRILETQDTIPRHNVRGAGEWIENTFKTKFDEKVKNVLCYELCCVHVLVIVRVNVYVVVCCLLLGERVV